MRVIHEIYNTLVEIGGERYIRRSATGSGAFWIDYKTKKRITDPEHLANLEGTFSERNLPSPNEYPRHNADFLRGAVWMIQRLTHSEEAAQNKGLMVDNLDRLTEHLK